MGTISRTAYSSGATITAAGQNSNENAIVNEINGNLDDDNIKSGANIAASKLNLATIAQTMAMSGVAMNWAKGADIASASTCDIGAASGNYVDVTGTTTITALGTVQAGTIRFVRFTGALTLTHNATSLILPSAANITTVANDRACFVSLGSGNWICISYDRASGVPLVPISASTALAGTVVQRVVTSTASYASLGSTQGAAYDDSIPQNTEGNAISALDTAITPLSATNKLVFKIQAYLSTAGNGQIVTVSLHQDATANAISASSYYSAVNASNAENFQMHYEMVSGTTSATTFKLRAGDVSAGNAMHLNGTSDAGGRRLGGGLVSYMIIEEVKV